MLYSRFIVLTILILMIEQSRGIEFGTIFNIGKKADKIDNHEENNLEHDPEQKIDQNKFIITNPNFGSIFGLGKNADKTENQEENKFEQDSEQKIDQNKFVITFPNYGSIFDLGKNGNKTENQEENKLESETDEKIEANQAYTKLSTVEEFLKTLLIPIKGVQKIVGKGVQGIGSIIPDKVKDSFKGIEANNNTRYSDVLNTISNEFRSIYPGTKWCGDGDKAKNDEDLGYFADTDACCRAHDKCDSNINAGEEKYGLINSGTFTRSHRSCDSAFYNCLKNANSTVATSIGITYFNILSPQSFDEDYPIIKCNKYSRIINKVCVDYEQNLDGEKKYQWFYNPFF